MNQELRSVRLLSILTAGLATGLLEIILAVSFGTLVFAGVLSEFAPQGIGLAILGMALTVTVIALFASLRGTVGGSQSAPVVIMAVAVAGIASAMPSGSTPEATFVTAVTAIALTTMLTGFFLFALGLFKLGSLARFLPYPVVGGFLAGTGWLLVTGAINMMIDMPSDSSLMAVLIEPDKLILWLPGLILALALLFLLRRFDHPLIFPSLILGAVALFYLIAWLSSASMVDLNAQGWLLGPFPEGELLSPISFSQLALVDWTAIWSQSASLVPIFLISAVSLLLNAGGLEISTSQDINLNRELRAAGLANIASGLAAGMAGYQQISLTALSFKSKAQSRMVGLIAGVLCILTLAAGASMLSLFPKIVIGALLLYLGLTFLVEWVVESWFRMSKIDYLIVIVILLVTMTVGFMEAVALGLLFAVTMFVIGYSRIDVVRHELTEAIYHSRVARSRRQKKILEQVGEQVVILELQGFIFFGTADNLLKRIRQRLDDPDLQTPRFLLLDFRRVTGLDSTATLSFARMQHLTGKKGIELFYTGTSAQVRRQLESGAAEDVEHVVLFVSSLDKGLEWCENQILYDAGAGVPEQPPSLTEQLAEILPDAGYLPNLLPYFEEMDVEAGYYLMRQGETSHDLFFIQDGQVTTLLEVANGESVRLGTIGGGVVGEIGFYLGSTRSASVVADLPSKLFRLTKENLRRMEQESPQAAANMHCIMVHLLSERVAHLVGTVGALER